MKLYLVRHGQSEGNVTGIHCGWEPIPLTEQGKMEAERVGRLLAGIHFDKVYTSDLLRAVHTAELALPGYEKEQTTLLREIGIGELAFKTSGACRREYGEVYAMHSREQDFRAYGGENYEMVSQRVKCFLDMVAEENCENIAAVCHDGILRGTLDIVLGQRTALQAVNCDNGAIAVFEYRDTHWSLCHWNLVQMADI